MLLNLAGSEAMELERSFTYAPAVPGVGDDPGVEAESRNDPQCLIKKFEEICEPRKNIIMERHVFNTRFQQQNEDTQKFIADLRTLSATCEYGQLRDDFVRDRIVCGIADDKVRFSLLKESTLTFEKAVEICMLNERSKAHTERFKTAETHEIRGQSNHRHRTRRQQKGGDQRHSKNKTCDKCGYEHRYDYCPAKGQQCKKCKEWNHFKSQCPKWRNSRGKHNRRDVHEVSDSETETESEEYVMESIEIDTVKSEIYATLQINGKAIEGKIDTGAKCNVISREVYEELNTREKLDTSKKITLIAFGGNTFRTDGIVELDCMSGDKTYKLKFHVLGKKVRTLIGLKSAMEMNLVVINKAEVHEIGNDIFDEYSDVFEGKLGKLPVKYRMKLNPEVKPVVMPPRSIPAAVKDRVKKELEEMEENKIIAKVDQPTEWVSALVAAKKKNKDEIRICIDPQNLNRAIERPHHPMKTIEQVVAEIPGASHFSTLDAKTGFWQICLDEQSSYYTTFQTPFGRYRFLRMPYGITSGSEVFQRTMEHLFENVPCQIVVDDILVWGKTESEHNENLIKVLDRAREINLRLNRKKCRINVPSVTYVGHVLSADGLQPDPLKTKAIAEMPTPTDKLAVQRFLGLVNYVAKFIPNLSEKAKPLRTLIKQDVEWHWTEHQQKSFDELKRCVIEPPVLGYYDVTKPVKLTCDASQNGLGAAILQGETPIAYASKAMTPTQMNYAQIEKELLAVLFAFSLRFGINFAA